MLCIGHCLIIIIVKRDADSLVRSTLGYRPTQRRQRESEEEVNKQTPMFTFNLL